MKNFKVWAPTAAFFLSEDGDYSLQTYGKDQYIFRRRSEIAILDCERLILDNGDSGVAIFVTSITKILTAHTSRAPNAADLQEISEFVSQAADHMDVEVQVE